MIGECFLRLPLVKKSYFEENAIKLIVVVFDRNCRMSPFEDLKTNQYIILCRQKSLPKRIGRTSLPTW